jgi:serine/threonine protein kinase
MSSGAPLTVGDRHRDWIITAVPTGGTGVCRGHHHSHPTQRVLITVLPLDDALPDPTRRALHRQLAVLSRLRHPSLPRILDFNREPTRLIVVEEDRADSDLRRCLAAGPLTEAQTVRYASQLADALRLLAEHGLPHQDIRLASVRIHQSDDQAILPLPALSSLLGVEVSEGQGDVHALGGLLAALLGDQSRSAELSALLDDMRQPEPRRRPTPAQVSRLLAGLRVTRAAAAHPDSAVLLDLGSLTAAQRLLLRKRIHRQRGDRGSARNPAVRYALLAILAALLIAVGVGISL